MILGTFAIFDRYRITLGLRPNHGEARYNLAGALEMGGDRRVAPTSRLLRCVRSAQSVHEGPRLQSPRTADRVNDAPDAKKAPRARALLVVSRELV